MHAHPSLDGKVIVVIGGTSGIGRSAAAALAGAGASIVVTGRSQEKLDATLAELGAERACGVTGDAAMADSANAAVALAVARFGKLDGLYHVAGGSGRSAGDGRLHEVTDGGIDHTININLKSLIYSNRAAVRQFLGQGSAGAILNMGSVLGFSPSPDFFASHIYAATKSAAIGFTKSIASYYAKDGIRANLLAPALVASPMSARASTDLAIMEFIAKKQPLDGGRIGQPEDLDQAALFFLSDASKFVTGQVLAVDGGWSVTEGRDRK